MQRMENQVSDVPSAKFQSVVARQLAPVHAFTVHERSVLATLVNYEELAVFGNDVRMFTRDSRIGDHQIAIHLAPNRVRSVIQRERLLLISLYVDHNRENTRHPPRRR